MRPTFFATPEDFRKWLEANHKKETELIVGYYKKDSGIQSITWPESVDEALCYGWIDGVRRSIDDKRYCIRFTPRKAGSNWSAINIGRVAELTEEGRMRPAGLAAFERRRDDKSSIYSYEQRQEAELTPAFEERFKANEKAWAFFTKKASAGYRKTATYWVMSAKQEATREKRLEELIADSAEGLRVKQLRPIVKKKEK